MRNFLLFIFSCFCSLSLFAQAKPAALLKGRILTDKNVSLPEVEIVLPYSKLLTTTDRDGNFTIRDVVYGNQDLIIRSGVYSDTLRIAINKALVDLGNLIVSFKERSIIMDEIVLSTISMEELPENFIDEDIVKQSISGVLSASRDPYLSAAGLTLGSLNYQIRGYQRKELEVYINGLLMNDIETDAPLFGQWGGLNDAFRNQSTIFGLAFAEDGFGGLLGSASIDATAANQRKQTSISHSVGNKSYRNRFMLTHHTGLMQNGWAVSVSASKRWAKEGYVPGTFYDGYSYFLGISKKLSAKSLLHFITFGSPTQHGKASATTQEAIDLTGSNYYNPNWGYWDGEKRNSKISTSFLPIYILNYEYRPNNATKLNIAAAYQTGLNGNSALDWYKAQDPRPDYYGNLPSYYLNHPDGADIATAEIVSREWQNNSDKAQVDWARLYEVNNLNYETVNGIMGKRALYVIGEDRQDISKFNFSAHFHRNINDHLTANFGLHYINQKAENYRKMLDLLGGDFYVNLNQFAEQTYIGNPEFKQNDLNHPDQIIKEGDKYQYNYIADFSKSILWGQAVFTYNKVDLFIGARAGMNIFSREGLYRNGLFQDDSYGKSTVQKFPTYAVKGGLTYKLDGRNYLFANGAYFTKAPDFDQIFFSPRTRNATINNIETGKIASIEGGYLLKSPNLNGRLSGFLTEGKGETKVLHYYNESYRTFVNYVMQGVDTRNLGAEFALQAKISPRFTATAVATWMQHFYTSRPDISVYLDNDTSSVVEKNTVYWKNYFVASGPQSAYTLGLLYNSPRYWWLSLNANYLNRAYLDVNPSRLTEEAVGLVRPGSIEWHDIIDQEQLPPAFTLDLFVGKSFSLNKTFKWIPRGTFLVLNIGVNNVLNNKNMITGGFQQLRFDYASKNAERFPSKYFYGYGANYFLNMSLRF